MRDTYLHGKTNEPGICRGGVSIEQTSSWTRELGSNNNYELEIGGNCNASIEMLALCAMSDEIIEFLTLSKSHLAKMILDKYRDEADRLRQLNVEIADKCSQQPQVIMESTT